MIKTDLDRATTETIHSPSVYVRTSTRRGKLRPNIRIQGLGPSPSLKINIIIIFNNNKNIDDDDENNSILKQIPTNAIMKIIVNKNTKINMLQQLKKKIFQISDRNKTTRSSTVIPLYSIMEQQQQRIRQCLFDVYPIDTFKSTALLYVCYNGSIKLDRSDLQEQ